MCPRENRKWKTTTQRIEQERKKTTNEWLTHECCTAASFLESRIFFVAKNRKKFAVCLPVLFWILWIIYYVRVSVVWLHDDYPYATQFAFNSDIFVISFFVVMHVVCRILRNGLGIFVYINNTATTNKYNEERKKHSGRLNSVHLAFILAQQAHGCSHEYTSHE